VCQVRAKSPSVPRFREWIDSGNGRASSSSSGATEVVVAAAAAYLFSVTSLVYGLCRALTERPTARTSPVAVVRRGWAAAVTASYQADPRRRRRVRRVTPCPWNDPGQPCGRCCGPPYCCECSPRICVCVYPPVDDERLLRHETRPIFSDR
jgi:hypothetical protein